MSWRDWVAEVVETAFRLVPVPVRTGVRIVGKPDRMSPVFVTGNYDLTVRRVLRALRGLDAYVMVANSRGVNVWCASSGGHLGTHQVVTALKVARLEEKVVHREVIVPQLAATGVEAKEVRRRTGWIVRFGPADAKNIAAYLVTGKDKTQAMREVRFDARQRFEMAAAWATPISLIASVPGWYWHHFAGLVTLVWLLALTVFFLYDRLPLPDRGRQAVLAVAAIAGVSCALALTTLFTPAALIGWSATALAVLGVLTFDYAGSSPTAPAGLFEEKEFRVVLDVNRCTGAYNCWAVCPEAVFEKQPAIHKVAIARPESCIRCGACLVQCPQDALFFEGPEGRRIGPEVIRRFKLNMLGKRATRIENAAATSYCSHSERPSGTRGSLLQPPGPLMLYRLPEVFYRSNLGWLLGGRFLLLSHGGRKSGKLRYTVLEVLRHDTTSDAYIVAVGFGRETNWYQNLLVTPAASMRVGRRSARVVAHQLSSDAVCRELFKYWLHSVPSAACWARCSCSHAY
ncbi:MAG: HgcAB-like fusion protein [Candidatus Binatia bacterium]